MYVLLHNRKIYGCIPIGQSVIMKEDYGNIKLILGRLKYGDHQWLICVDLKTVNFFLVNKEVTQNTLVSFATGTVELTRITGLEWNGYQGIG